jgi:tripartite-type tricarboxylate transporter receptor subunit TctC
MRRNTKIESPAFLWVRHGDFVTLDTISCGTHVVGGSNHVGTASVLQAAGVAIRKLRTHVFKSGGESVIALVGGHRDLKAVLTDPGLAKQ